MNLTTKLIQKRLVCPTFVADKGNSTVLARQLDGTLMQVGFKMSKDLLKYVGSLSGPDALKIGSLLLDAVRQLVGDHVKHNVYFKDFPKNVPDTLEFWGKLLARYYEDTGTLTNNLLDFPEYGRYQHTYDEMVESHAAFKPKKGSVELKTIALGGPERTELMGMFCDLAGSVVPLNEEDRALMVDLFKAGFHGFCDHRVKTPVRENKAILNALWMAEGEAIDADTPLDILRLACYLSGGDVTLTTNTKFVSFKRPVRRALLAALNDVIKSDASRIDDIAPYKEVFKRLAAHLHPFEYKKQYKYAARVFAFASGDVKVETWQYRVQDAVTNGRFTKAINLLTEKPGVLVRSLDNIARKASDSQFAHLLSALSENAARVSGRVLLSLIEHLDNRRGKTQFRLFVNKKGTAYVTPQGLEAMPKDRIEEIQDVLWEAIKAKLPVKGPMELDPRLQTAALPISEKTKSEGFRVLPRGSVFALGDKPLLRFFIYWHQATQRTDYDLSAVFLDKDFNMLNQISWTNISAGGRGDWYEDGARRCKGGKVAGSGLRLNAYHSGDIVDATNGASEFIDVDLSTIDPRVAYILPSINAYAGDPFAKCKEAFMGFMMRDLKEMGKPYEAATVETRFDLRGEENGVGIPMVFSRTEDGWQGKWLDLYSKGQPWGNRIELNRFSTALLTRSMVERRYLTLDKLVAAYNKKGTKAQKAKMVPIYVGLDQPDMKGVEVYTLDNLKALIPA